MNIAELFINLGVTGSKKTKDALGEVKGGLKEAGSMALETKAAIVAAIYAVERMFSASNKLGSGLANFNAELGVSTDTLQRYQYAAQQVGVSNEVVTSSFKALQSTVTKILMGEGIPKGFARVALTVGDMELQDLPEYQKNPEKLIQKLQEYVKKEKNIGLRNEILKQFGLSEEMIAALVRQAFQPDVMARAPVYSQKEIKALDQNNAAWKNLGQQIEMAFGQFNAKHGAEIIASLSQIAQVVFRLVEALTVLGEKLEIFDKLRDTIAFVADSIKFINDTINSTQKVVESGKTDAKAVAKTQERTDSFLNANKWFKGFYETIFGKDTTNQLMKEASGALQNARTKKPGTQGGFAVPSKVPAGPKLVNPPLFNLPQKPGVEPGNLAPTPAPVNNNQKTSSVNVEINQTNEFSGSPDDPQRTAANMKDAARFAFRQLAAQTMGA